MGIGSQRTDVRKENKIDFNKWTLFGSGFKEKKTIKMFMTFMKVEI